MGAWGTGIYENDLACNVRDWYEDSMKSGTEHAETVEEIVRRFFIWEDDAHEAAGWYAVADCALSHGIADETLNRKVLRLIADDPESMTWINQTLRDERKKVLERLRKRIMKGV